MAPRSLILLASVLLLSSASAGAAGKQKSAPRADDHSNVSHYYEAGRVDYEAGHFADAAREFQKAYDLSKNAVLLFNVGQSWMRQGDAARAIDAWEGYLAGEPNAKDRAQVEATVRNLRKETGTLRLEHAPDGALLEIDGVQVARTPLNGPVLATAGQRDVSLRTGDGTVSFRRTVPITAGQEKVLDVTAVPEAPQVVLLPPPVIAPEKPTETKPTDRPPESEAPPATARASVGSAGPRVTPAVLVTGIGGVALLVGGGALLGVAGSQASSAMAATREEDFDMLSARARRLQTAGIATLAVGGLACAGAATLYALSGTESKVAVVPGPGGVAVAGRFP